MTLFSEPLSWIEVVLAFGAVAVFGVGVCAIVFFVIVILDNHS